MKKKTKNNEWINRCCGRLYKYPEQAKFCLECGKSLRKKRRDMGHILEEMKKQEENKDPGNAHFIADNLLIEALVYTSKNLTCSEIAKEIIHIWKKVGKCY